MNIRQLDPMTARYVAASLWHTCKLTSPEGNRLDYMVDKNGLPYLFDKLTGLSFSLTVELNDLSAEGALCQERSLSASKTGST
jgi:hypothetical protein